MKRVNTISLAECVYPPHRVTDTADDRLPAACRTVSLGNDIFSLVNWNDIRIGIPLRKKGLHSQIFQDLLSPLRDENALRILFRMAVSMRLSAVRLLG